MEDTLHTPSQQHKGVSVAMCTYNGSLYLPDQLASIASQTVLPDEMIVCDDSSTDETVQLVNSFAKRAPFPVRLIHNAQKLGPAKNFEKAIGCCEGDIIVLCDQDDIWYPTKVRKLLDYFGSNPDALYVFSDAELVDSNGQQTGQTLWNAIGLTNWRGLASGRRQVQSLLYDNYITGAGMAVRASLAHHALPVASGWMHDYWLGLIGSALSRGVPIPDRLFKYRRHAAQVCGWKKKTYWQSWQISWAAGREGSHRKLSEFRELQARLKNLNSREPCPREILQLLEQKEHHLVHRDKIRKQNALWRIARVLRETLTGRYFRFSSSPWNSILRDFFA